MTRARRRKAKSSEQVAGEPHVVQEPQGGRVPVWMPWLLVVVCAVVYINSFDGKFFLDDARSILESHRIRDLSKLSHVMVGARPLVNLTFAVNYAVGEFQVAGYHAVNLLIHILAGLTLFALMYRLTQTEMLRGRFGRAGPGLAMVVAAIWLVHPLQTQSVTYIVQRAESMMGLFYLLTLYCVVRGATSDRGMGWYGCAVVAAALGMGSKSVAVTIPVVAFLMDAALLSGSFRASVKRRWGLYVGLVCAVVGVLAVTGMMRALLAPRATTAAVGFGVQGTPWYTYAATQPGVILHYLRLAFVPYPQCLDYVWPDPQSGVEVAWPALVLLVLAGATIWAWTKHRWLGFVGAFFFVVLGPTSSIVPIADRMFEHRMYLPLASVIIVVVAAGYWLTCRIVQPASRAAVVWWAAGLVVVALGARTIARNSDYHDEVRMWTSILELRPNNARAALAIGTSLYDRGDLAGAEARCRQAIALNERYARAYFTLGRVLVADKLRLGEATEAFAKAVALRPTNAKYHYNYGVVLSEVGRVEEAEAQIRDAIKRAPRYLNAHTKLGLMLKEQGRDDEAKEAFQAALALNPNHPLARSGLAELTGETVDLPDDIDALRRMLHTNPDDFFVRFKLAQQLASAGQADEAISHYRQVVRDSPTHAAACVNLGALLMVRGDVDAGMAEYRRAIEIDPNHVDAHVNLAGALTQLHQLEEAEKVARRAVLLGPDSAAAHNNLAYVLALQRRVPESMALYRKALALDEDLAMAHFGLALGLASSGELAEAIEEFKTTLRLDPSHTGARDALRQAESMLAQQQGQQAPQP